MTKQYIIKTPLMADRLDLFIGHKDFKKIATLLNTLPLITGEPVAWIWVFQDGSEEVVFIAPNRLDPDSDDIPTSITPLYTSPQPPQSITAEDVNSSMIQYLNEHTTPSSSRDEIIAAAYNAVIKIKHRGDAT